MNRNRLPESDMSTLLPMRNPTRIPRFTQALTLQPCGEALGSGSAALMLPVFRPALNSRNVSRSWCEYASGLRLNNALIRDSSIPPIVQVWRQSVRQRALGDPRMLGRSSVQSVPATCLRARTKLPSPDSSRAAAIQPVASGVSRAVFGTVQRDRPGCLTV